MISRFCVPRGGKDALTLADAYRLNNDPLIVISVRIPFPIPSLQDAWLIKRQHRVLTVRAIKSQRKDPMAGLFFFDHPSPILQECSSTRCIVH